MIGSDSRTEAVAAGRKVANDVAQVAARASFATSEDPCAVLGEALTLSVRPLAALGARLDVLRCSGTCVVVRTRPAGGTAAAVSCGATRGLLEVLPGLIGGTNAVVFEDSCAARGADTCLYSVLWQPAAAEGAARDRDLLPTPYPDSREATALEELLAELDPSSAAVPSLTTSTNPPAPSLRTDTSPPQPRPDVAGRFSEDDSFFPGGRRGPSRAPLLGRFPWVRRRAWLVALMTLLGSLGGAASGALHGSSSSAETLLVVRSGGTGQSPGSAQEAAQLALTYAALLPDDTAFDEALAARLGDRTSAVRKAVSVSAVTGTALLSVSYSAPSPAHAIAGARAAARLLTQARPPGSAIVSGSVAAVSIPSTATSTSPGLTAALAGGVLGLLVGLLLLLLLEGVDARIDDAADLAEECACPATAVPDGMSIRELATALALTAPDRALTVVPLSDGANPAAVRLAGLLASWWPGGDGLSRVPVVPPYDREPWQLSDGAGPTVLVVSAGERSRQVTEACKRLELLGRRPVFGVLARPERGAFRRGR